MNNSIYSKKTILANTLLNKLNEVTGEVYIFIHKSMDGDCIGSACGLCEVIRNIGINSYVVIGEPVLDKMKFLNLDKYVLPLLDAEAIEKASAELVIAVDCSEAGRMGAVGAVFDKVDNRVIVDHHETSVGTGDNCFIVPEASSASELCFYVSQELEKLTGKSLITKEAAQFFLTGIVTDTGRFAYSNTNPETLEAASNLMELGAEISPVMYWFFDWKSKEEYLVSSAAAATARFDLDGKVASITVTRELFDKYNANGDQIGEVVSKLRDVDGVVVAIVLRELTDGKIRVNFRSLEPFDCVAIATQYNGGGHLRAAGCTVEGDIELMRDELVNKAIEALK